jgi:hypothetical protein
MIKIHNLTETDLSHVTHIVCERRRDLILKKGHASIPLTELLIHSSEPPLLAYPIKYAKELMLYRVYDNRYSFAITVGYRSVRIFGHVTNNILIIT